MKEKFAYVISYKSIMVYYRRYVDIKQISATNNFFNIDADNDFMFQIYYNIFNLVLNDLNINKDMFFKSVITEYVNKALSCDLLSKEH